MKNKLKLLFYILIIVLISIIAFVGVYTSKTQFRDNALPKYSLSSEFTGKRITYLQVDDSTSDVIKDKDGKIVDSIPEDANKDDYTTEKVPVNSEEVLNSDNYKKMKEILDNRLEQFGTEYYLVKVDDQTGDIVVELEDNNSTDTLIQNSVQKGDFSIIDSETKEVLLDRSHIVKASVVYGNNESGAVVVYLQITFDEEGKEKLAEITRNYVETEETEDSESEENHKHVSIIFSGTTMLTTGFKSEITNGELTLSMGTATSNSALYQYISNASIYSVLLNNPEFPITYKVTTSEYINSNINQNIIYFAVGAIVLVCAIVVIYLIAKYKTNGLICSLGIVLEIAMLLILIRYTSTVISLGTLAALLVLVLLEAYCLMKVLNKIKENESYESVANATIKTYLDMIDLIVIFLIIAIVFTFMKEVAVYSIGMTLFYGIISIAIANLVFVRGMLLAKYNTKND